MDTIFGLVTMGVMAAIAFAGFSVARNFVRNRLRFVDAARSPVAPVAAGILAFVVAAPLAILPFVSLWPAVLLGFGAAFGTASGIRALRRADYGDRRLMP